MISIWPARRHTVVLYDYQEHPKSDVIEYVSYEARQALWATSTLSVVSISQAWYAVLRINTFVLIVRCSLL